MAFKIFVSDQPIGNKSSRHSKRAFSLPPFDVSRLLQLHPGDNTYTCQHCKEARKKGQHKTGYGAWIHKALWRYR